MPPYQTLFCISQQHSPFHERIRQILAPGIIGLLILMLSGCGGGGSSSSNPAGGTSLTHYSYTDLGAIGSQGTHPTGVNDAGVITGYFNTSDNGGGPIQPFRHTGKTPVVTSDALELPTGISLGANPVSASNINSPGTVVGTVYSNTSTASVQAAFVYDTSFHNLGSLPLAISGVSRTTATAISDGGTVIGYDDFDDQSVTHSFRHTGTGPLTAADDLGTFAGYTRIRVTNINQGGVIAGTATADNLSQHAFIYETSFHDLGTLPNCTTSVATGINNSGVVIGYGNGSGVYRSFRHLGTVPLTASDDLGQLPGSSGLAANAVNSSGDVVGNAGANGGQSTAFIYKAGGMLRNLSDTALIANLPSGFGLQIATAINNKGQVVGYTNIGGTAHAWLLTPTP